MIRAMFAVAALTFGIGQSDALACGCAKPAAGCAKCAVAGKPIDGKDAKPAAGCCAMSAKCCAAKAAPADDKPGEGQEAKVTGALVCGKCNLKETAKCSNVLQVKEKDKVVNYYLTDKGNGETYHEGVCGGDKVENVTVTGTLTEKDGKKTVKPTKVELPKK